MACESGRSALDRGPGVVRGRDVEFCLGFAVFVPGVRWIGADAGGVEVFVLAVAVLGEGGGPS